MPNKWKKNHHFLCLITSFITTFLIDRSSMFYYISFMYRAHTLWLLVSYYVERDIWFIIKTAIRSEVRKTKLQNFYVFFCNFEASVTTNDAGHSNEDIQTSWECIFLCFGFARKSKSSTIDCSHGERRLKLSRILKTRIQVTFIIRRIFKKTNISIVLIGYSLHWFVHNIFRSSILTIFQRVWQSLSVICLKNNHLIRVRHPFSLFEVK